jgi:hypothetical protein
MRFSSSQRVPYAPPDADIAFAAHLPSLIVSGIDTTDED